MADINGTELTGIIESFGTETTVGVKPGCLISLDFFSAQALNKIVAGCLLELTSGPEVLCNPNLTQKFNVGIDIP